MIWYKRLQSDRQIIRLAKSALVLLHAREWERDGRREGNKVGLANAPNERRSSNDGGCGGVKERAKGRKNDLLTFFAPKRNDFFLLRAFVFPAVCRCLLPPLRRFGGASSRIYLSRSRERRGKEKGG